MDNHEEDFDFEQEALKLLMKKFGDAKNNVFRKQRVEKFNAAKNKPVCEKCGGKGCEACAQPENEEEAQEEMNG